MAILQKKSVRKITGGRYRAPPKKAANAGSLPMNTKLGEKKLKQKRIMGGHLKSVFLTINKVNVLDKKTKKSQLTDISAVLENAANRNFIRRGILTKGAVVNTPIGKARITSRPGQVGTLNAVLIE